MYAGDGFVTCPGDVFTIQMTPNCISNSISVRVTNEGTMNEAAIKTDEYLGLPNNLGIWTWLKKLNDMGGRSVMVQRGEETPINFEDSAPYKCRF